MTNGIYPFNFTGYQNFIPFLFPGVGVLQTSRF